jgi:uncharacterized protein YdhG (YjbR/CyaY superfamily)
MPFKTPAEYLAAQPPATRKTLEAVRKAIKAAAPKAEEYIGYQVPTFRQDGQLVAYGAGKQHCSLYVMSPKVMSQLAADLKGYKTSKGSIFFEVGEPLPASLVRKVVKARLAENKAGMDPYHSLHGRKKPKK